MTHKNDIPFTPEAPETHLFILTAREARVVARALQISAVMAEALDNPADELVQLRDRFAPEGLDT